MNRQLRKAIDTALDAVRLLTATILAITLLVVAIQGWTGHQPGYLALMVILAGLTYAIARPNPTGANHSRKAVRR